MENNKENLENLVLKLREQGIGAGKEEKERIIAAAKEEARDIVAKAEKQAGEIISEAEKKSEQVEANARASLVQASRDMVEATRMSVLNYMKGVFGQQVEKLFTSDQYLGELLKAVLGAVPGDKQVAVSDDMVKKMEAYLVDQALADGVELKPLGDKGAKIVLESKGKEKLQFVLSSRDVEQGLFSMLNRELLERITKGQGEE